MLVPLALALLPQSPVTPLIALHDQGFPGSTLVVDRGVPLFRGGTSQKIYPIGSITKWFTGLVILKLESDGKVQLSDTVGKFIPNVPESHKGITIRHLLTHSAGLLNYVDKPGEGGDFAPFDKAFALKRILSEPLLSEPGKGSEYSNAGYVLLAAVIEKATGGSYEAAVRKFVIKPAGLKRTGFHGEPFSGPTAFAIGSGGKTRGKQNSPYYWPKPSWSLKGAGGIVSTAEDLGLLVRAITQNKIVPASVEPRLFQPLEKPEGYGWMAGTTKTGTPRCSVAGGDDYGFFSALTYQPHEGRLLIGLTSDGRPKRLNEAMFATLKSWQ